MSNDEKFAKTIDDEELDEVAGGTKAENAKDVNFLKALGLYKEMNDSNVCGNIQTAWFRAGIFAFSSNSSDKANSYKQKGGKAISRNDAMIYAMRDQNKYLNLEDYI